jgi:predicted dehydrogenase
MRFALLGDHPDGLHMARALAESGRHEIAVYSGPPLGAEQLARHGLEPHRVGDVEEVLADPRIQAIIVAGGAAGRPVQLRRALQSERHVLCVHPADRSPDVGHEAAMIQADTGFTLLPLLPEALHPGIRRFAELTHTVDGPRLLEFERWSVEELLVGDGEAERTPALPGWDVLRAVGGEIAEVFAVAGTEEELMPGDPLLLAGRFVDGLLFQATLVPQQAAMRWRLALVHRTGRMALEFPDGWPGPAHLTWTDSEGHARTEEWPPFHPWAALALAFDDALADDASLTWQDELRCLELDDAVRRSVARRRSSTLEYQEATEEAGFKGTMTLLGCGLLWGSVAMLILAVWWPMLAWFIAPVFAVFLLLQVLRWAIPTRTPPAKSEADARQAKLASKHTEP